MPLTSEQRSALAQVRAYYQSVPPLQLGTAESVDERARSPNPAHLPTGVTARVEIAPPSPHPHPLLKNSGLKTPERVPVCFYALHSDQTESEITDTRVIFFIHGGGNVTGHPADQSFIGLITQLLHAVASHSGGASKCAIVAPSYRLATVPENTFPAALQDVLAAYEYILEKGYKPSNIVLAGGSAGANHGWSVHSIVDRRLTVSDSDGIDPPHPAVWPTGASWTRHHRTICDPGVRSTERACQGANQH